MLVSLPKSRREFGGLDPEQLRNELTILDELQPRADRVVSKRTPVNDEDIYVLMSRRLFESTDADAAEQAARAYRQVYEKTPGLYDPAVLTTEYMEQQRAAYPLHPVTHRRALQEVVDRPPTFPGPGRRFNCWRAWSPTSGRTAEMPTRFSQPMSIWRESEFGQGSSVQPEPAVGMTGWWPRTSSEETPMPTFRTRGVAAIMLASTLPAASQRPCSCTPLVEWSVEAGPCRSSASEL